MRVLITAILIVSLLLPALSPNSGCKWRTLKLTDVTCHPIRCIANGYDGRGIGYTVFSPLFVYWRKGAVVTVRVCE